jgi:hypothetical protein
MVGLLAGVLGCLIVVLIVLTLVTALLLIVPRLLLLIVTRACITLLMMLLLIGLALVLVASPLVIVLLMSSLISLLISSLISLLISSLISPLISSLISLLISSLVAAVLLVASIVSFRSRLGVVIGASFVRRTCSILSRSFAEGRSVGILVSSVVVAVPVLVDSVHAGIDVQQALNHSNSVFTLEELALHMVNFKLFHFSLGQNGLCENSAVVALIGGVFI